jgi:hypothetical protein
MHRDFNEDKLVNSQIPHTSDKTRQAHQHQLEEMLVKS